MNGWRAGACAMTVVGLAWTLIVAAAGADGLAASYRAKGQAGLDRLEQTEQQRLCSGPVGMRIDGQAAARIQKQAMAQVRMPSDGRFTGTWQEGEKIAQTGTGLQSSDDPAVPSGGNCYACHELAPGEMSYGTLGPSLAGYGKTRGRSEAMLQYTWTRLWNPHAHNPCSHMPRFGDAGILTEQQIRDVMALLFDPDSPVNR